MKKSDFSGWQEVFGFSLVQGLKQKTYYVSLIIISVIMLFSVPFIYLLRGAGDDEEPAAVTKLTVYDETGLSIDYSGALRAEARLADVNVATAGAQTYEEHVEALKESTDSTEMLVRIRCEQGYFSLTFVKAAHGELSSREAELVSDTFQAFFNEARIRAVDVTDEQMDFLNRPVKTKVEFSAEDGSLLPEKPENEGISMMEYNVLLGGIMLVMMVISFSGGSIANSIVVEKTTRVVEYLMINVRAMALIVGKILANLVLVAIQLGAMGTSYFISSLLGMLLFDRAALGSGTPGSGIPGTDGMNLSAVVGNLVKVLPGLSVGNVLLILLTVGMGILLYAILAGLAGASVSKLEELGEGMKLYQLTLVAGAYLAIGLDIVEMLGGANQGLIVLGSLLPISSPFITPANLLIGKISPAVALAGLAIQAACVAALFVFTSMVYESMIFYNGSVLKLKNILQLARERGNVRKEKGGRA